MCIQNSHDRSYFSRLFWIHFLNQNCEWIIFPTVLLNLFYQDWNFKKLNVLLQKFVMIEICWELAHRWKRALLCIWRKFNIFIETDGSKCNSTQTLTMSVESFVSAHMLFQSILPYLLPFSLMIYPICQLILHFRGISDIFYRDIVRNIIVLSISYVVTYTPLALLAIIIFPTILQ